MLPLVGPGPSHQSTSFWPLTKTRLGSELALKTYVPVVGASTQPVSACAKSRSSAAAEMSAGSHDSAASAHAPVQAVVQQPPRPPLAHTAAAQALQELSSASPVSCSLCEHVGTRTMPFRSSVGGAAGPSGVSVSSAYTNTSPEVPGGKVNENPCSAVSRLGPSHAALTSRASGVASARSA